MATILIVDDSMFMRTMIKNILVNNGYTNIIEAENGKDAVEKYNKYKPALVFMDITMNVMNGIDALKEIRKTDNSAKVIMCSAMGQKSMVMEALELGAKDFIVKPFREDHILECLKNFL